jgi:predicted O-methyltransferase YrrM
LKIKQRLGKLRDIVNWQSREAKINPAQEDIYRYLFLRDITRAGIDDVFYPVASAANYSLLYLVWRCLRDLPITAVLELGAGQSTLLLDRARTALAQRFTVRTIEHDAFWAKAVADTVSHTVVHTAFAQLVVEGRTIAYYDVPQVLDGEQRFDLVLVDGPPAESDETRYSRSGCAALLERCLAEDFVVIVDDAERDGEAVAVDACRATLQRQGRGFGEVAVTAAKRQHIFASERFRAALFF